MNRQRQPTFGFTLLEMLGAMAIGTIILITAASLLGTAGSNYSRIGGGLSSERDARAFITQLGLDLATASYASEPFFEKPQTTWPGDRIGFTCLQPSLAQSDEGRIGDLCAVHYYLENLSIGGKTVRCLMRGFHESHETFAALTKNDPNSLLSKRPEIDEPMAMRVVAFEARPKTHNPDGSWSEWTAGGAKPPDAVSIRLIIARPELASRLKTPGDWDGNNAAGNVMGNSNKANLRGDMDVYETMICYGIRD